MVTHSRAPVRVDRLRALNTPLRMEVELDERGMPVRVRRHDGSQASPNPSPRQNGRTAGTAVCHIEAIGEIWRVDDEWWRKPISRRYVEVMLEGGRHTVLYQDLFTQAWFEQLL